MSVTVEVARSAAPPTRCGTAFAAHWIAFPEAARVAIGLSDGSKRGGGSASHSAGILPAWIASNSFALSGSAWR